MSNAATETPPAPAIAQQTPSHIVFATDFSATTDRAQDRAVQLAVRWNASLTAVHALSDVNLTDDTSLRDAYRAAAKRSADLLRNVCRLAILIRIRGQTDARAVVVFGPQRFFLTADVMADKRIGDA